MNLFRIRGIQVAVHFTFPLLLAYFAYVGWQEQAMTGLVWNVLTVSAFFACVVLHELGHSFTGRHFGVNVSRILLMPIGGMAEFDSIPREPRKELLITLAGPAVNFALAALLWIPVARMSGSVPLYSFPGLVFELFWANLVMGLFNLVPAFPMDGGRILRATLATRLPYLRATRWAVNIGKVFAVAGAFVMLFYLDSVLGGALFVFIFFAGDMEYRAAVRREREDAYWRDVLAKLRPAPGATQDPPVTGLR